jgi:hypothetical protein
MVNAFGPISPIMGSRCWIWDGAETGAGYGFFKYGSTVRPDGLTSTLAHIFAWQLLRGPVPDGLELDHLCRITLCCNPDHLEPVTHRENILRGNGICALNFRKTHCKRGHEFDSANTRFYRTSRICRACERDRDRKRQRKQVAA